MLTRQHIQRKSACGSLTAFEFGLWMFPALVFAFAASISVFRDGASHLEQYLQFTVGLPYAAALLTSLLVTVFELLIAFCLVWTRLRRLGWILTGGFSATCAPFHIIALATGDPRSCPCMGIDLLWGGVEAHAFLAAMCVGMFATSIAGGYFHRAQSLSRPILQGVSP